MAHNTMNFRPDACVICGYGKRRNVQAFILSKIVGMEITTAKGNLNLPIRYKFLLEGGHEIEIDDRDEVEALREVLIYETERRGGRLIYI